MNKSNNRKSFMANPEFVKRLKIIQGKILEIDGERIPSLTELTENMIKFPEFNEIERKLINKLINN